MAPWVHTPRPHPTQTNQTHQLKNELIELTNSRCQRSQREWGITKYSYNSFGPSALHIPNKASNLRGCKGISEWFVGTHLNSFVASGVKSKKRSCFAPPSAFIFLILGHFFQLGVSKFLPPPSMSFAAVLAPSEWVRSFLSQSKRVRVARCLRSTVVVAACTSAAALAVVSLCALVSSLLFFYHQRISC